MLVVAYSQYIVVWVVLNKSGRFAPKSLGGLFGDLLLDLCFGCFFDHVDDLLGTIVLGPFVHLEQIHAVRGELTVTGVVHRVREWTWELF